MFGLIGVIVMRRGVGDGQVGHSWGGTAFAVGSEDGRQPCFVAPALERLQRKAPASAIIDHISTFTIINSLLSSITFPFPRDIPTEIKDICSRKSYK